MDYSLFVAKISLNNDEIKSLFGRDHRKATEKQFLEMIGKVRESRPTNSSIEKEQTPNCFHCRQEAKRGGNGK